MRRSCSGGCEGVSDTVSPGSTQRIPIGSVVLSYVPSVWGPRRHNSTCEITLRTAIANLGRSVAS